MVEHLDDLGAEATALVEPGRSTEVELLTVPSCSGLVVRQVYCCQSADLQDLDLKLFRLFRRLVAHVGPRRDACDGLELVVRLRFNDVSLRACRNIRGKGCETGFWRAEGVQGSKAKGCGAQRRARFVQARSRMYRVRAGRKSFFFCFACVF